MIVHFAVEKKRKPAPSHEDLQDRFYQQDLQIQSLLHDLDKMKMEEKIRQWLERAKCERHVTDQRWEDIELAPAPYHLSAEDAQVVSVLRVRSRAKKDEKMSHLPYPQGGIAELTPPDIITYAVIAPEEIPVLFRIFFDRINVSLLTPGRVHDSTADYSLLQPFFSLLDPELHTPSRLIWSCPFLFTVICAIASRFYTTRPNVYILAMEFARDAAGKALVDGSKSVDVCQAYVLLGVYPTPGKKWVKDRSWLFMGIGIRMALELGIHLHLPPDLPERERLNRTRTWLNLFCVDSAHANMFGKQPMSMLNDIVSRSSFDWYRSSQMNLPYDIHLCGYVDILLLMTEFRDLVGHDTAERVAKGLHVIPICLQYEQNLARKMRFWSERYLQDPNNSDAMCNYRGNTTQLIAAYLRLVILAVGFPFAVKKGIVRESPIVQKSIEGAFLVIDIVLNRLYPTGILRFAMEANFVYVAFAASFLINLLRPKFLPLLDEEIHRSIIKVVRQLINVLGSKQVALDGRHTPALYSKFLSNLLEKYDHQPAVTEGPMEFIPQFAPQRQQTPPCLYSWPDNPNLSVPISEEVVERPVGTICQASGEVDMDFSLQFFMHTTQAQYSDSPADQTLSSTSNMMETGLWDEGMGQAWASGGPYSSYRGS
ncbi:hypothetical protein EW146_g709 [Bondarzewia mesenterica]|uniref:Xylanolytic transcriptional activator regulatory domain-containing protein n=1 Tax=Bondarzewia mesenterica TaxID=1095465 RepID=A0A4S4M7X2_9AGAM|nr:hypothetical protein EW146_g709 [Bondarzewia mesenterica]